MYKIYIDASPMAEDKVTGIPHFTAEMVRALAGLDDNGKKFKIVLVIPFDKKQKLQKWKIDRVKIKVVLLPMRLFNLFWKYNLLPPMDIFLGKGYYIFPNYKNWKLRKSYSLTYIHDLGFIRYPQFVRPNNLLFLESNINKWISRANIILTGSNHTRQEIIELLKVKPERVVRIYHGVDRSEFYPRDKTEVDSVKRKYGLEGKYLLYLGSLEPRKNLVRTISSYCSLPKQLTDKYSLCLVGGNGWLNEDIIIAIDQAKKNGYNIVRPTKYVGDKDIPGLLSGASALLYLTLYEGFGLPPLQAMACGTPAIVADNSSLPEVVGKSGALVDGEKESEISAKIVEVLTDDKYRSELIASGLKQADNFSWQKSAQQLIKYIATMNTNGRI